MGIRIENVSKSFITNRQRLPVLADINFEVADREFVSIVGPSGSGKTTLFNIIAGVERPDAGRVWIGGRENRLGDTAYMLQKDLLFPWRTALDNAILGIEIRGTPRKAARAEALGVIDRFGLIGFERHYPRQLSGGQRQRVALMRTILCNKEILLLDEPFGALDAMTRQKMHFFLQEIWAEFPCTILFITHDIDEAVLLSDRVLVLSNQRPATLIASVPVALSRPRRRETMVEPAFVEGKKALMALVVE
jgi:ABC-type nitrate/sulfonate/bicarbonate transport system ATPase subunit